MKSTEITKNELLSKELKALADYLAIVTDERNCLERIARSPLRRKLTRIRARKEVFKLDQEIEAKLKYMLEITKSINILNQ